MIPTDPARVEVVLEGSVQGVGMRPYLCRIASRLGLTGSVRNELGLVRCEVQGEPDVVRAFLAAARAELPPRARLTRLTTRPISAVPAETTFIVLSSVSDSNSGFGGLPPDIAICDDCVRELFSPGDRRYRHAFISCTQCGPRYTIATALPWDRARTSMAEFPMCPACHAEYIDPHSRRYHAETICCSDCGPVLTLRTLVGGSLHRGADAIAAAVACLRAGQIVAVKGVGGFQLAARADLDGTIARLRLVKHRPDKPLALLARECEIDSYALADPPRRDAFNGWQAPIVLMPQRRRAPISAFVAPAMAKLGLMRPYTGLHHLLLAEYRAAIVLTSANHESEPMIASDNVAATDLPDLADVILTYERAIVNPVDDSVVDLDDHQVVPLRVGRGLIPLELDSERSVDTVRLAVGADLKCTLTLQSRDKIVIVGRVGTLAKDTGGDQLEEAACRLSRLYGVAPTELVADQHPGYASREWAAEQPTSVRFVQHHVAHIAAVQAEHHSNLAIGAAFDGFGYQRPERLAGGELFSVTPGAVTRVGGVRPYRIPRGDAIARRPDWTACCVLSAIGLPIPDHLPSQDEQLPLLRLLELPHRSVETTSVGRLFDAVAALLDLRHLCTYEGQAAMELEALATEPDRSYPFLLSGAAPDLCIDFAPTFAGIISDIDGGVPAVLVAARFHAAVADWVVGACHMLRNDHAVDCSNVYLGGGVFGNLLLRRLLRDRLTAEGFMPCFGRLLPANDESIGVGQLTNTST